MKKTKLVRRQGYIRRGLRFEHPEVDACYEELEPGQNFLDAKAKVRRRDANKLALIGTSVVIESKPSYVSTSGNYKIEIETRRRQHNCSHRKGGPWITKVPEIAGTYRKLQVVFPLPPFMFDFNVSLHTFIDGHQEIKCMTCKRVWRTGDADFAQAMKMVENSSNKPSASEHPFSESAVPETIVTFVDTEAIKRINRKSKR